MDTLFTRLKAARIARHLTLRDVERISKNQISNAYLCQIEKGSIEEPSPLKLRTLSVILKLNYLELMILAGYITIKDLKGRI